MRVQFGRAVRVSVLLVAAAAVTACGTTPRNPSAPEGLAAASEGGNAVAAKTDAGAASVHVCHRTAGSVEFVPILVARAAVESHMKHGDGVPGGPVPQRPGMTFDEDCDPALAGATITFAGLTVGGASFTTYTESGLTVVPTQGDWQVNTNYGNPEPFIEFLSPAEAPTVTAAVTVSAGGALFTFASVDLYSSLTPIPYVFTGLRNSMVVFTAEDTQPNTFGDFVTVANPYATESIDTLVIALSNPADVCCPNATGLDNIVIVK